MKLKSLEAFAACVLLGLPIVLFAQEGKYPSRPVRILVPFTAGTNADTVARLFAQKLSERMGQPFVVENRAGAGGVVASQALLGAPADGYMLMLVSSAHAANPSLNKNLPYDTTRAFSGIAMVGDSPIVVVVHPSVGAKTQADLVAIAKQKPGFLNYSSAGIGSAAHFACEYFRAEAGIDMLHVPFKGTEYVTEVLSGRVHVACPPVGLVATHVRAGTLLALSVTSKERVALLPQVLTTSEAGLANFEYSIWYGLLASSKTPRSIVEQLAGEMSTIVKMKDVSDAMVAQGITPKALLGSQFDTFIGAEIDKLRRVARVSGIQAE